MTETFVFDTYAIFEIIEGNKNYEPYIDSEVIINNFIFAELCYNLHKDDKLNAEFYITKYSKHISNLKPEWIEEAMIFRYKNKKKNLSMTDCISYFMAKHLGIKFLTGDKEFKDLENVEFVK